MQHKAIFAALGIALAACGGNSPQATDDASQPPNDKQAPPWDEQYYNFVPADGDIIVQGPCGSRFTFRPVQTHTIDNWLAAETVLLGQGDVPANQTQRALLEGIRSSSVIGAFTSDDDPTKREYFIGKYEITQDQYQAVLGGICPEPSPEGSIPVSEVSYFDTQRFAVALNEWIYNSAEAKETLPQADQIPALVRLPTEAEWEFAARGGQAVSSEERLAAIYPMDDTENRYEWYAGDDSCAGNISPVGYLNPNPLGIHDMLGNVREIVQDPFQLTAGRRYQGQTGAMLAKGGACDTPIEEIRSAARREYLLYDYETGSLNRPAYVGFRLALGAPAIPSNKRLQSYQQAYSELRLPRSARLEDGSDPAMELRELADGMTDIETIDTLERIASAIDAEMVDRNTFETESAKALVATSSTLIRNYRFAAKDADSAGRVFNNDLLPQADRAAFEQRFRSASTTRDISRDFYTQLLVRAAEFDPFLFQSAARFTARESEDRVFDSVTGLTAAQMMCLFATQVENYRTRRPSNFQPYFDELRAATPRSAPSCPIID